MTKTIKLIILSLFLSLSIGCSSFYVKVIDQHGEPVPDVKVRVGTLTNLFLVSGSKTEFYNTDDDGRFNLGGPRVGIELIHKNGYEFRHGKGFGSTTTYSNFKRGQENSYSNPYYILAWKREKPEKLLGTESSRGTPLFPNNHYYKVDIVNDRFRYPKKQPELPLKKINAELLVRFKENKNIILRKLPTVIYPWEFTLAVPNGGLIETDDIIRNLAPKAGYQQTWTIRSNDLTHKGIYSVRKKFYLKSNNGNIYGQFAIEIIPDKNYLWFKSYWLNTNSSRNLTRPKKYIYCKPRDFVPENCSIDNFGP